MAATLIAIADAVAATLNAATFGQPLTAVRSYQPEYGPADTGTLKVSVVPEAIDAERKTRATFEEDHRVSVLFQHRTDMTDSELDALMELVEEVADHLKETPLSGLSGVQCVAVSNAPVFAQDRLAEFREFCSLLVVTYKTWR